MLEISRVDMNETYEMGYGFPKPFKLCLTPCVIASDLSKIQTHKHTQAYKPTHIYIINGKKTSSSLFIKCYNVLIAGDGFASRVQCCPA